MTAGPPHGECALARGLDHADTLLARSITFRSNAPVLAEMAAFLKGQALNRQQVTIGAR